jgi:crotonobetainyl-CoA:carnitine CoA-transferase CaiB-like acyl-CoA transferase
VRIVDFGTYFAGPFSSKLLADLGAKVIKLESVQGDPNRGNISVFEGGNRGKRGIAVDLKSPEGQQVLQRLAERADIVHHNLRPGVADRLGADYLTLAAVNPTLIFLESPGFGLEGPKARLQSFAPLHSGFSGIFFASAGEGNGPIRSLQSEDYWTGLFGAFGLLVSLLHRRRTGEGQHLVCSQMSAALYVTTYMVVRPDGRVEETLPMDSQQTGFRPSQRLYRTTDGWVCVASSRPDVLDRMNRALESQTSSDDDIADVVSALESAFEACKTKEIVSKLLDNGVVAAPVRETTYRDEYLLDLESHLAGRVIEVNRPDLGSIREIGPLMRFSGSESVIPSAGPVLGEHTEAILDELGYERAEIEELLAKGVVKSYIPS